MSAVCPKCGIQIDSDFGLVTCGGCNSVLSIQFDGSIQISDENPDVQAPSIEELVSPDPFLAADPNVEPISEELMDEQMPAGSVPAAEEFLAVSVDSPTPELQPEPQMQTSAEVFSEVIEFAENSDASPFHFTLEIHGIDFKTHLQLLKDIFLDKTLGIDAPETIAAIHKGQLTLNNLNPAQASYLKQRLLGLGFRLKWTQQVL